MTRKEKIILVGNLNKVLFLLDLSDAMCLFLHNNDITVWQTYEVEKQWKKLKQGI